MNRPTILYVDDEADNLSAFRAVFRRFYDIKLALNAQEALAIMEESPASIVISDQRMPEMTGVELFEQLKESFPYVKRIILTGYSDMQAIIDGINKGKIYHYISKPWKFEEFKLIIDNAHEAYMLRNKNNDLERQNVQAQFEVLKNQINPHFLFNSMNTLAALISIDTEKAIDFTKLFSKLYRSVLSLRNQKLISVEEELEFVQGYLFLQKLRFGGNIQLEMQISDSMRSQGIPPFALQLLIENAIKHNVVSSEKPLQIQIEEIGECLCISNNLQPKFIQEPSTGIGLSNLHARYEILNVGDLKIEITTSSYRVYLPTIPCA